MRCIVCGKRAPTLDCPKCERRQPSLFSPPLLSAPFDAAAAAAAERKAQERAHAEQLRLAKLKSLGRPVKVALIGCGKKKAAEPRRARELYQGHLFQFSLRYALATCDESFVLSALHSLVTLDTELPPYNFTMRDFRDSERQPWGEHVVVRLAAQFPDLPLEVVGLAGHQYLDYLRAPLRRRRYTLAEPLDGLGVGERLAWLKQATAKAVSHASPGAV